MASLCVRAIEVTLWPSSSQDPLQVGGDQRLVLDDQHVGRDLPADLAVGLPQQLLDPAVRNLEDLGGLAAVEVLDGHQQEGLARLGRQRRQRARRGCADLVGLRGGVFQPRREGVEKALVEARCGAAGRGKSRDPRRSPRARGSRPRHRPLAARQQARKPPQVRQMRGNLTGEGHGARQLACSDTGSRSTLRLPRSAVAGSDRSLEDQPSAG